MNHTDVLKQYFGYDSFREGQEELVENILMGRDVLGVMPTGAGKSICFQVPALIMDGVTIVISPLISLMADQVSSLVQAGIRAAYINSSLTPAQMHTVINNAAAGAYKIIYVAPERLETDAFSYLASAMKISMITVDEAHCISHWGQDFRPSYLKITEFVHKLPYRPIISAFTATATQIVRDDICSILDLNLPFTTVTGFDRKNLYFGVEQPADKYAALKKHIKAYNAEGRSGIVYCSTRKNVELVCDKLNADGFEATRYHAGLSENERRENQDSFICDRYRVMVATNAFGMGIDKSNVSYVIHYNMPKDVESYYQEAGRAGRDGSPSDCIMLYGKQDVVMNRFLIDKSYEESDTDPEIAEQVRSRDYDRLRRMTFYCTGSDCLRSYILKYFGERSADSCGNCSICCESSPETDITTDAQKILSCIFRCGQKCSATVISHVLKGKTDNTITAFGFDKLSTYGIMKDVSARRITAIIDRLEAMGYIAVSGEYRQLTLTSAATDVLKGRKAVMARLPEEKTKEKKPVKLPWSGDTYAVDDKLLLRLKDVRLKLAMVQRVPAYVIFSDATLRDMCAKLPSNEEEFRKVSGVGQAKLERYGEPFLNEIKAYLDSSSPVKAEERNTDGDDPVSVLIDNTDTDIVSEEALPITVLVSNMLSASGAQMKNNVLRNAIYSWLEVMGYMESEPGENNKPVRSVTPKAEGIGIHKTISINSKGERYNATLYSSKAQRYIINHLKEICLMIPKN